LGLSAAGYAWAEMPTSAMDNPADKAARDVARLMAGLGGLTRTRPEQQDPVEAAAVGSSVAELTREAHSAAYRSPARGRRADQRT